uniref:Uncharacterized protein n=1 Tax=Coprothermobacter proteolyticus (strain ATCC 35245 / DSM 5265 / OCM 4 / BT) TaxID=309798 RepID=B5Y6Y2_COPPD
MYLRANAEENALTQTKAYVMLQEESFSPLEGGS